MRSTSYMRKVVHFQPTQYQSETSVIQASLYEALSAATPRIAMLPSAAVSAWLFLLRNELKVTGLQPRTLASRNRSSGLPVAAQGGPVVSVTSHGERIRSVYLALESIASGRTLPSRLILWLDDRKAFENLPPELVRLQHRGLEVYLTDNFGPHTKYYPYLQSASDFTCPLVTADDDQLYTTWWLSGLVKSFSNDPESVSCYRAHVLGLHHLTIKSYNTWRPCHSTSPSLRHFATGVSGCIYPPAFLEHLKNAGDAFMQLCPRSDDAWLHLNAVRSGTRVRQICDRPLRFPAVPGSQKTSLFHGNVVLSGNDAQIQRTYGAQDIAALCSAPLP